MDPKMDSVMGVVEKHETVNDGDVNNEKPAGVALKSDHDNLGLRATAWRFKKVYSHTAHNVDIVPVLTYRPSLFATCFASPLRATATKST